MVLKIARLREVQVYRNDFLTVFDDDVQFPNKSTGKYVRIAWNWPYNVGVVPVTLDGKAILIKQFCYARQRWIHQIPKGMGSADLQAEVAAAKEMSEETGYTSDDISLLKSFSVDPGLLETPLHVFIARNARRSQPIEREQAEVISEIITLDLKGDAFNKMVDSLEDAVSIASLYLARSALGWRANTIQGPDPSR